MPTRVARRPTPSGRHVYKYRDYVIRALNADKPWSEFLIEQLAGDELVPQPHKNLTPDQIDKLVATGFLRMAVDATGTVPDLEQAANQVVADTIKIVSSALLGLTVGCAQCHDHRYDPISQRDYYALRAVFEPALNPGHWRFENQRFVSLNTEEEVARSAAIEAEAVKIGDERTAKAERTAGGRIGKRTGPASRSPPRPRAAGLANGRRQAQPRANQAAHGVASRRRAECRHAVSLQSQSGGRTQNVRRSGGRGAGDQAGR